MTNIEEKYLDFFNQPFPKRLVGKDIFGIDLVMLDADTAGLIDKFISYKEKLLISDFALLEKFNQELKIVTKELKGNERSYFSSLWNLCNQVVENLNQTKRFLKDKKDEDLHKKWKKDFKIIRKILNEWDPLGVADIVEDEYDDINFTAYSALLNSGELSEIEKTINNYLISSMGIYASDKEIKEISEKIKNAVKY